jgi:hypothetical protein
MAIIATTQAAVLDAIVQRLKKLPGADLNDSTCFVTLYPERPGPLPPGDLFLTVSPGGGTFDPGWHEGGGEHQTKEDAVVFVTIFSRQKLDRAGRDDNKLLSLPKGLLEWKRMVLRWLSNHDLQVPQADGTGFGSALVNAMAPLTADAAESHGEKEEYAFLKMGFSTDFLWDLTS